MKNNLALLLRALAFAAHKHRDQRRKDRAASPYINHPIALATVLTLEGRVKDPEVLAAALLHDTIEDTRTTYPELKSAFGARVARTVLGSRTTRDCASRRASACRSSTLPG